MTTCFYDLENLVYVFLMESDENSLLVTKTAVGECDNRVYVVFVTLHAATAR